MICVYCCAKENLIEVKGWKDIGDGSLVCNECYGEKLERNKRQARGKKKYRKRKEAYEKLTKERVKQVFLEVDELDLPDGAHFQKCGDILGVDRSEVVDFIKQHPIYFGLVDTK